VRLIHGRWYRIDEEKDKKTKRQKREKNGEKSVPHSKNHASCVSQTKKKFKFEKKSTIDRFPCGRFSMAELSLDYVPTKKGEYTPFYLVVNDASLDLLKKVKLVGNDWDHAFVCLICVDDDADNLFYKKVKGNGGPSSHLRIKHKLKKGAVPDKPTEAERLARLERINSRVREANHAEPAINQEDQAGEEEELATSSEPSVVVRQTRGNFTMVEIKQVGSNLTIFPDVFLKGEVPSLQDLGEKAGAATLGGVVLESHHDWVTDVPYQAIAKIVSPEIWFQDAQELSVGPQGSGKVYNAHGGFADFYAFLDAFVQANPDKQEAREALRLFKPFDGLPSDPSWSLVFFGLVARKFGLRAQWDIESGLMNVLDCEPELPRESALFQHLQNGLRATASRLKKTNVMTTLCNPYSCRYASAAVENVTRGLLVDIYASFEPQLQELPTIYYKDIKTEVKTLEELDDDVSDVTLEQALEASKSADQETFWQHNQLHRRVRHMARTAMLLRASDEMGKKYIHASRMPKALTDLAVFKTHFLVSLIFFTC